MNAIFTDEYDVLVGCLIEARRRAGVSQRELAARMGRSPSHIHRIEHRQRRIEFREFYLICKALGSDPVVLFRSIVQDFDARRAA